MDALQRIFALYEQGNLEKAEAFSAALTAREPDNVAAWALRGQVALKHGRFNDAVDYLERAIAAHPEDIALRLNLGMALYGAGEHGRALLAFKMVLKREPSNAVAFLYTGRCHLAAGRFERAASAFNATLALRPDWAEAFEALAALSLSLDRPDKALLLARRALQAEPGRISSLEIVACAAEQLGDHKTAAACYRALAAVRPDAATVASFATSLQRMGRHESALAVYDYAHAADPENPAIAHGLGSSLLALGRLREGWPLYAKRFAVDRNAEGARAFGQTLQGPPRPGMRVTAWADQGIGEQILFASLIPDLLATGAAIAVECDYRLVPLFTRSFPGVTACAHTAPPDPALASFSDGRFCLSDAAAWFRRDFSDFPAQVSYLAADPALTTALRAKYRTGSHVPRPLIGISWRRADGAQISAAKSLPLAQWGPILHVAGCTFVNLQYGDTAAEAAAVTETMGVRLVSDLDVDPLINLDAFAAQVAAMDLVISISSTTAHMAGALGVPAWTLLPVGMGSLWHWFLARDDSPWYPRMKLFRQAKRGDWDEVLGAASAALVEFVEAWRPGREDMLRGGG